MSKYASLVLLAALLAAMTADAATPAPAAAKKAQPGLTQYSLLEGIVGFAAPSEWTVMLKKDEGLPQFVALHANDPSAPAGAPIADVSVDAKVLNDADGSQALIGAGLDKARQTPGFEARNDAGDANALHYFGTDARQRFEYREAWSWWAPTKTLVHVRCTRPLLASSSATWVGAFDAACARIMREVRAR